MNLRMDTEGTLRQLPLTQSLDRASFDKESAASGAATESAGGSAKEKKLHVDVNLANRAAAAAHTMHSSAGYFFLPVLTSSSERGHQFCEKSRMCCP